MPTKLFVGNMPYKMNAEALTQLFSEVGTVSSSSVILDRETRRSRGFGFVEMSTDEETQKALETLNGREYDGRKLVVSEAREKRSSAPREPRDSKA